MIRKGHFLDPEFCVCSCLILLYLPFVFLSTAAYLGHTFALQETGTHLQQPDVTCGHGNIFQELRARETKGQESTRPVC